MHLSLHRKQHFLQASEGQGSPLTLSCSPGHRPSKPTDRCRRQESPPPSRGLRVPGVSGWRPPGADAGHCPHVGRQGPGTAGDTLPPPSDPILLGDASGSDMRDQDAQGPGSWWVTRGPGGWCPNPSHSKLHQTTSHCPFRGNKGARRCHPTAPQPSSWSAFWNVSHLCRRERAPMPLLEHWLHTGPTSRPQPGAPAPEEPRAAL